MVGVTVLLSILGVDLIWKTLLVSRPKGRGELNVLVWLTAGVLLIFRPSATVSRIGLI